MSMAEADSLVLGIATTISYLSQRKVGKVKFMIRFDLKSVKLFMVFFSPIFLY